MGWSKNYKWKTYSAEIMSALRITLQKSQDLCPPVITRADECRSFKKINPRKASGPDGILAELSRRTDHLADVFMSEPARPVHALRSLR